jgi:Ni,Fe-hydrogenase I cytochrome b subunit
MILYIIRWTVIYVLLICLLHKLYLFFQDNLTTTKNKDYYNNVLIEPIQEPINEEPIISSKDLNNDFTYEMKNELNNFISKIKT